MEKDFESEDMFKQAMISRRATYINYSSTVAKKLEYLLRDARQISIYNLLSACNGVYDAVGGDIDNKQPAENDTTFCRIAKFLERVDSQELAPCRDYFVGIKRAHLKRIRGGPMYQDGKRNSKAELAIQNQNKALESFSTKRTLEEWQALYQYVKEHGVKRSIRQSEESQEEVKIKSKKYKNFAINEFLQKIITNAELWDALAIMGFYNQDQKPLEKSTLSKTVLKDIPLPNFLEGTALKQRWLKNETANVSTEARKIIILLFHYIFLYENFNDNTNSFEMNFEDFYNELNAILQSCGLENLYYADPFDWLVMKSMKNAIAHIEGEETDFPVELINEVLELSFC